MKTILVVGDKTFKISVPDDSIITFGPWSPGKKDRANVTAFVSENIAAGGTLRVYDAKKNILACFAHVTSFRDLSLEYNERVVVEEGSTIWNSDKEGYKREHKQAARQEWVAEPKLLNGARVSHVKAGK